MPFRLFFASELPFTASVQKGDRITTAANRLALAQSNRLESAIHSRFSADLT
jgi:hypothetical protein